MEVDRSPSLNLESAVLPKGEWQFVKVDNQPYPQLHEFIPGTWIKPESWMNKKILAAFSCPNCKEIRFLIEGIHTIDHMGRVKPDVQCKARASLSNIECSFHRRVYLDKWNKKTLYAVAIENWTGFKWTPEIRYTHADSEAEARFMMGEGQFRIVACGPAVGFFVEDKVGDKLNVEAPK
jgi:hypothetical protein